MEYETFVSGIGGQGIQLISKMFAVAAMANGRHVMPNGVYGGEMRGGKSLATVVIGVEPLRALPVTAQASATVVPHGNFWEAPRERLHANALILADSGISAHLTTERGEKICCFLLNNGVFADTGGQQAWSSHLMDFHEVRLRLGGTRVGHEFASPDIEEKC